MNARAPVPLLTGILGCAVGVVIGLSLREEPGPAGEPKLSSDALRRPVHQRAETATAPSETSAVPSKPASAAEAETIKEWTDEEAIAAAARASALPEGAEKVMLLNGVIGYALRKYGMPEDASPLLAALDKATADSIRVSLLSKVQPDPFSSEPNSGLHAAAAEIARILHSHAGEGDYLDRLGGDAASVAWHLADENPAAGTEWAMSLPPEARRSALQAAIGVWAGKDAPGASEWVNRMESGFFREAAVMGLIEEIKFGDPESALVWASSLADTQAAKSLRKSIFENWIQMDADAAFSALQQLTKEERKFILSRTPDLK